MRPLFTATHERERIKRQFQKMRLAEANGFINGLGINPNDVKSILRKYREQSRSVIEKTRTTAKLLDADHVPPSDIEVEQELSPWKFIFPPYWYISGDRWNSHGDTNFGWRYIVHSENHKTGEISCHSQLIIHDPGDHAWYSSADTCAVLIIFQIPASGLTDAWSYLECVESSYSGFLIDEFGWSDVDVEQTSRYFMSVGFPNETPTTFERANYNLLDYYRGGEDEGHWYGIMAQPGHINIHILFPVVLIQLENGFLWLRVLMRLKSLVVNDMEAFSDISSSWIVRNLAISAISL